MANSASFYYWSNYFYYKLGSSWIYKFYSIFSYKGSFCYIGSFNSYIGSFNSYIGSFCSYIGSFSYKDSSYLGLSSLFYNISPTIETFLSINY